MSLLTVFDMKLRNFSTPNQFQPDYIVYGLCHLVLCESRKYIRNLEIDLCL